MHAHAVLGPTPDRGPDCWFTALVCVGLRLLRFLLARASFLVLGQFLRILATYLVCFRELGF